MIKLKQFLLENPDTVKHLGVHYSYTTRANRSSFMVYNDIKSNRAEYFGYDRDQKRFYGSNSEFVSEVENLKKVKSVKELPPGEADALWAIRDIDESGTGGGHDSLWTVIEKLKHGRSWTESRGRVFVVPDESKEGGTATIMSFWNSQTSVVKDKKIWDDICGELKIDPLTIIYNPGYKYFTYDEFYGIEKKSEVPSGNTDGSPTATSILEPVRNDLADMKNEKEEEYIKKSGDLHVRGATLTVAQKSQLKREVDSLAAEIDWLEATIEYSKLNNIQLNRNDSLVVMGLKTAIEMALEKKEKDPEQPYNLNAELEKQFPGMSVAEIRQKFSHLGIPLRKFIKEMIREIRRKKLNESRKFSNNYR